MARNGPGLLDRRAGAPYNPRHTREYLGHNIMSITFQKLSPTQLETLGYSRTSERYLTSAGAVISKRQYQKAREIGSYNPKPIGQRSEKYSKLGKQGAHVRATYRKIKQQTGRTDTAKLVNKLVGLDPENEDENPQDYWTELMEGLPTDLQDLLRQIIYQKQTGKR